MIRCYTTFRFPRRHRGFTLIELLVVISVIGILAAMVVMLAPMASRKNVEGKVKGELNQLITVIETYKAKKGFYPPSNPKDVTRPPLYYELLGTELVDGGTRYRTLNGASDIARGDVAQAYGIDGFVNSTRDKADADAPPAEALHKNLKDGQVESQQNGVKYLAVRAKGPDGEYSRWRYNSTNPTNNPESFDLWVEVTVSGAPKIYGNWKQ